MEKARENFNAFYQPWARSREERVGVDRENTVRANGRKIAPPIARREKLHLLASRIGRITARPHDDHFWSEIGRAHV